MKSKRKFRICLAWALIAGILAPLTAALAVAPSVEELVPSVHCSFPNMGGTSAVTVPTTFKVYVDATDPDDPHLRPWKYRYLWIPAEAADGTAIYTKYAYEQNRDELITWDSPLWSQWELYPESGDAPALIFTGLTHYQAFLLALQVMDRDGAVSTELDYQQEVANVLVSEYAFRPLVKLTEFYLGTASNQAPSDQVASGQPLNFSWIANADAYNGSIASYQYGWNVLDVSDPNDPGWAIAPGVTPEHLYAPERIFTSGGLNRFVLRVEDSCGTVVIYRWTLDVIPFVAYEDQYPLLLIDQVVDDSTGRWEDQTGVALDDEAYRNAYWHFLDGAGGVAGFDWDDDRVDHSQAGQVEYSDLVAYKAVLCYARMHSQQYLMQEFRAENDVDKYVWLTPYQQRGGNFFLVGDTSLDSFIESKPNYYVPTVFDSTEPDLNGYETSFGTKILPDGSEVARGPLMYHYDAVGISALDWSTSGSKTIYGRNRVATEDRDVQCAGLKGLVLDPGFESRHLAGSGDIADTLYTDVDIDWHDYQDQLSGTLELASGGFPFLGDEFVDANISSRTTPILPQECAEGPGGLCIEPMFTGFARFDYLREQEWAAGNTGWPGNEFSANDLGEYCGPLALTEYEGIPNAGARTNGQTYGFLSHKMVGEKESGRADVYWGFDPYRFDHQESQKAIRWVLDYFRLEVGK